MKTGYFVFECYSDGQFLFRSFGCSFKRLHPLPEVTELRAVQKNAVKEHSRLTYSFISSRLNYSEAIAFLTDPQAADISTSESRDSRVNYGANTELIRSHGS